jgi:sugar lactone lactonase YvrE
LTVRHHSLFALAVALGCTAGSVLPIGAVDHIVAGFAAFRRIGPPPVVGVEKPVPQPADRVEDCSAGPIDTIAGTGQPGFAGDGGPAILAPLNRPAAVYVAADGTVYICNRHDHRIRRVAADGTITTVAGSGWTDPDGSGRCAGDGGPAIHAHLDRPQDIMVSDDGIIYIADTWSHVIRKVDAAGIITTIAGGGAPSHGIGDGGPATEAILSHVGGPVFSPDGSYYISEWWAHRVRMVDPAGTITTVAGNGTAGYSGDGGPATQASLNAPFGMTVAKDGSLYIAEWNGHVIRKLDSEGIITTVAGDGQPGYTGDGGPAAEARIHTPGGLALGADGSLYVADIDNHAIRKISPEGTITTVAGIGHPGYSGDGDRATEAALREPRDVAMGPDGSLYIADFGNNRIRRVRLRPCDPVAAKAKADALLVEAGESIDAWREVVELYMVAQAWENALAAAEQVLTLTPETDEPARMSGEVLVARVYAARRDDHEARRRLMRILARANDTIVLREAADVLADLYLLRGEREQAIATLDDLRLRSNDKELLNWVDQRVKEIAGE